MPKKFYTLQAKDMEGEKVVELRIYDEIGFWGVTAKHFMNLLDEVSADATRILVSLNSPGGNVFDAFAIYNALLRSKLPVTTRVDGVAASAASLVFMAGDERLMPKNAMLMMHEAFVTNAAGTADDLRKTAEMIDKNRDGIVAAYARSGLSSEKVIEMMQATTWMDAQDALSLGFCTEMEEPVRMVATASALEILARLPGTPQNLIDELSNGEDPEPKPEPVPEPEPKPASEPEPIPAPVNSLPAAELAAKVVSMCQEKGIPSLSTAVLLSGGLESIQQAEARVEEADQIMSLCASAKLSDRAAEFIEAGLGAEQVRARLFDHVVQSANRVQISNLQRDNAGSAQAKQQSGLNASSIYAARRNITQ